MRLNEHKLTIIARGHENILATHKTTMEITKETHLSRRGNCVIGVGADKALKDLDSRFKELICTDRARVTITLSAGDVTETINATGNHRLRLTHPTDIVVRKSTYICGRTLAIHSDRSAGDLSRKLVERLKDPEQEVEILLDVKT